MMVGNIIGTLIVIQFILFIFVFIPRVFMNGEEPRIITIILFCVPIGLFYLFYSLMEVISNKELFFKKR